MKKQKQASTKRARKAAGPVAGAVGVALSMSMSSTPSTAAVAPAQASGPAVPPQRFTLSEEEVADVSLATFYVFDKENDSASAPGGQTVARGCRGCGCCPIIVCGCGCY
jgi:hypothetical protein